jgi:hypothetical protein
VYTPVSQDVKLPEDDIEMRKHIGASFHKEILLWYIIVHPLVEIKTIKDAR